jgi:hypothetical protein
MRILPISKNLYAGYDISTAKNAKLSFDIDKQGKVTGLTVHSKTGDIKASKA